MDNISVAGTATRATFLVVELQSDRSEARGGVTAVVSRPGREGTFQRTWRARYGILDVDQAADLAAWLSGLCSQALIGWTGVQGSLKV